MKDKDGGLNTGYIVKLNGQGTAVLAATYLDGTTPSLNNGTSFAGLALDSLGNVFVGGSTGSSDFPLLDPFTSRFEIGSSIWEMVLAEMSPDLSKLEFGSFLSSTDGVTPGSSFSGPAVDSSNNLIVAGTTYASTFPTTNGSLQTEPPPSPTPRTSFIHSFVSKLNMSTAEDSIRSCRIMRNRLAPIAFRIASS
ncbi:MAG: SBBP repeat-containing protein [Acidobacteriaceae bacterium]